MSIFYRQTATLNCMQYTTRDTAGSVYVY